MQDTLEFHPIANIFPLLPEAELKSLADDIKANGLENPIWLYEGKVLDGRNRYKACQIAEVQPRFQTYSGDSPAAFTISHNLKRRHLTPSQAAASAVEVLPWLEAEAKLRQRRVGELTGRGHKKDTQKIAEPLGESREHAAALFNTNRQYVSDAKAIKEKAPEKFEEIKRGEKTIVEVKKELRKEANVKKQEEAAKTVKKRDWIVTGEQRVIRCDAVITDPPYGILDEPWEPKKLMEFTKEWAERWNQCGADLFLIFWSQRYLWEGRNWFDETLTNYKFQQLLIWHYPNNKSPQSREGFKQTWEPVFFYRKVNSCRKIRVGGAEWGDGLNDFDCHVAAVPQSNFGGAEMKQHPAQKPVSVFRWLINATTEPGELVVDPFCGSGASGIAAIGLQRKYHGIEISQEYRDLSEGRIAAYGC